MNALSLRYNCIYEFQTESKNFNSGKLRVKFINIRPILLIQVFKFHAKDKVKGKKAEHSNLLLTPQMRVYACLILKITNHGFSFGKILPSAKYYVKNC